MYLLREKKNRHFSFLTSVRIKFYFVHFSMFVGWLVDKFFGEYARVGRKQRTTKKTTITTTMIVEKKANKLKAIACPFPFFISYFSLTHTHTSRHIHNHAFILIDKHKPVNAFCLRQCFPI